MDNFICIITGPIGAGKSYLRYMLLDMGFEVLDLDKVSSDILHSSEGQNFIKENFGEAFEGGIFSKARLSEIVFSDREKLNKLYCVPFKFENKGSQIIVFQPDLNGSQ